MTKSLLPLLALTILLGACSTLSKQAAGPVVAPATYAYGRGVRTTVWGELPGYDQAGQHFQFKSTSMSRHDPTVGGTLTLDILVNHDGSVRDIAVFESSGDRAVDHAASKLFTGARYSLKLAPEEQAPHVVRQTITLKNEVAQSKIPSGYTNYSQLGPQPNYSGPPPANSSNVTSNP